MSRTMVANIPGARLRDVERQLAEARGEEAVGAVIEAHTNESKVLQQLVEWRRAGKTVPPLARVQRAMLWSDGTIELSATAAPEAAPRGGPGGPGGRFGGREGSRDRAGGDRRGQFGGRGPQRTGGEHGRPSSIGAAGGAAATSLAGRAPGGEERRRNDRVGFDRGGARSEPRRSGPGRAGDRRAGQGSRMPARPEGTRRYILGEGTGPTSAAEARPPRDDRRGRPGSRRGDEEGSARGLPRGGEGWVLLREGDAAPPGPTLGGYDAEPLEAREEVVALEAQTAHASAPAEAASAVAEPVAEVNAGAPRADNQGD